LLVVLSGMLLLVQPAIRVQAQDQRCFSDEAPAITACIEGRFLTFWEANGGLAVFGYPLTDLRTTQTEDGTFLMQYFERARFELHPENAPPYDVLLGRLGVESLRDQGQDVSAFPTETPIEGCQFWAETQHNVCGAFLDAWLSEGIQLDDDPELSDVERLALWGLPLSSAVTVTTDGGVMLTQYFERARFEQQPDGRVTFGLLGAELLAISGGAPTPAEPTPPAPAQPLPPPAPSAPTPFGTCKINAPQPIEGLQAWMIDPNPARGHDAAVCLRLIVNGNVVNGAQAMAYRYFGNERVPSIPQSTGLDGVAGFIFYTGDSRTGVAIPVEVVVSHQGVTYSKFTGYTPR
jgi:hypothetical protein